MGKKLVFPLMLAALATSSWAAELKPSADSYVRDGSYASANYGTATSLLAKATSKVNDGYNRETYLKFDVSGFPSVSSAILKLNARLDSSGSMSVSLYGVPDSSWSESAIVFGNRPAKAGLIRTVPVSGTSAQVIPIDVSDYVKAARAAGQASVSFAILGSASLNASFIVASRESATPAILDVVAGSDDSDSGDSGSGSGDSGAVKSAADSYVRDGRYAYVTGREFLYHLQC